MTKKQTTEVHYTTYDEAGKDNLIKLVKYHKNRCSCTSCDIQISVILAWLIKRGIKFTKKERENFI